VGCRFHPRCPFAKDICRAVEPKLSPVRQDQVAADQSAAGRLVACHIYTTNEWTQDELKT
jgi:peptide/nickel transport system ATP-binding protein